MAEVIHGNANANLLNARADKSQVYGLKGNDTLTSSGKRDVLLVGGSGDDSLIMSGGNGTLSGGDGSDTFELTYSATKPLSAVIEDLEPARDKIVVNFDGNTAPQLSTTTSGNDVVLRDGNLLSVTLNGVRDNDYFDGTADDNAWKVLELTNAEREAQGLSALTMADGLTAGAEIRVEEITSLGTAMHDYEHTRPDNKGEYYTVLDGKYNFPGENLDGGARSPAQVVQQEWMKSYDHRENILRDDFQKLGVAYNEYDEDPSNLRFYWVQLFADSLKAQQTVDVSSASPQLNSLSKFVQGDDEPNTISNGEYGVTIDARGGGDFVTNTGLIASVSGGEGDDTLNNSGNFATLNGGLGNDSISLNGAQEVVIQYAAGDGSDTVSGLNASDTVSISGDEFTPAQVGNDIIVTVGSDSITLLDAARSGVQLLGSRSKIIVLTDGSDSLDNTIDGATIQAKGGNDTIENYGANVSIDGATGNDSVWNYSASVSIDAGAGDNFIYNDEGGNNVTVSTGDGKDSILNRSANVSIGSGDGEDSVRNLGDSVSIDVGAGNDSIYNYNAFVTISGGAGNKLIANDSVCSNVEISVDAGDDNIINDASSVTISTGAGNDLISNEGSNVLLGGGAGNDTVLNFGNSNTIDGGTGNDSINNAGSNLTINGGSDNDYIFNTSAVANVSIGGYFGNDTILNEGSFVTINGGYNDDTIILSGNAGNNLIEYSAYGGNDVVTGLGLSDTLKIGDGTGTYSTLVSGNNVIVSVGDGNITLRGAASLSSVNIEGTPSEASATPTVIILTEGADEYRSTIRGAIIGALGGNDSIQNNGSNASIDCGDGDDLVINLGSNVLISGENGDDYIYNTSIGANVSIACGPGDDSILSQGKNVTLAGGDGDDLILLSGTSQYNLIVYGSGNGNDTIIGFNANDTLMINYVTAPYSVETIGSNVRVNVDTGTIILGGAASLPSVSIIVAPTIPSANDNLITLSEGNDTYNNTLASATIAALGGDDFIESRGAQVSINGGADNDRILNREGDSGTLEGGDGNDDIGNWSSLVSIGGGADNDSVYNTGSTVTIDGNTGDDLISNQGSLVSIVGGLGNDTVWNNGGSSVTIDVGAGDNEIENSGANVTINALGGNDKILNSSLAANVTITAGDGDNSIRNSGTFVTIEAGNGNDTIANYATSTNVSINGGADSDTISNYADSVTVDAGGGNDLIDNSSTFVSISGGTDDDTIINSGANATINAGAGNDQISLSGNGAGSFILYTPGDGDDTIWGLTENSTLQIGNGHDTYSTVGTPNGDDIIVRVGNGSIRLANFRDDPDHIIIGESGTSGGGSNSNSNGNSSGGNSGNGGTSGSGGQSGGNTSGGTSSNEGRGSAASGGRSASGSSGRSASTGSSGGNSFRRNSHSTTDNAATVTTSTETTNPLAATSTASTTTQQTATQRVYTGSNQVIADYTSGERIVFGATYTGAFFDGNGNFFAGSTTGALVVQNATDKVIDLGDAAGNSFVKAYSATTAGIIDGRGLDGFELINGSAGNDAIYAGDGGSQLWGGADTVSDAMLGGGGTDIFIGGKNQGADFFLNASSTDIVHLNDATLSDIVATAEENGTIGIAFNTGNVVAIQSSEALSATVMLADGSAYRFNHENKSWIRN